MAAVRNGNVCTMRGAYNPQLFWCSASNQRAGGEGGAGSDPAGAAGPFGGFGFFGLSILRAPLGGGVAG